MQTRMPIALLMWQIGTMCFLEAYNLTSTFEGNDHQNNTPSKLIDQICMGQ